MSDFHAAYPDYAATARLDELRAAEYSYLDAGGHTYLDYTGAGLAADAQLRAHAERLRAGCFGNPGAGERAFGLSQQDLGGAWWHGGPRRDLRTVDDYLKRAGLPSGGAVRVSLGLVSNLADVERFPDFAEQTYRDAEPVRVGLPPRLRC